MGATPTEITTLTADQFAARMAAVFPPGWSSASAKQPGGVLYGVLEMIGAELSFEEGSEAYALAATRIQTAIDGALDLAGLDFFGTGLYEILRNSGESDASYSARLIAAMLPSGATRPAVASALQKATGYPPRLIEPWRTLDTGVWDGPLTFSSFWDVDQVDNPFRWTTGTNPNAPVTDLSLAYQGFAICVLPTGEVLGNNPTPCLDEWTIAFDIYGAFMDIESTTPLGEAAVYNAVNRTKAEGTTVWVQFEPAPPTYSWDQPSVSWDEPGVIWDL